jgi:hypothetical protein
MLVGLAMWVRLLATATFGTPLAMAVITPLPIAP